MMIRDFVMLKMLLRCGLRLLLCFDQRTDPFSIGGEEDLEEGQ
jgi:hypothetical protein